MFCRKCGKQIPDDSDFCPKCGTQNCVEIDDKISLKKSDVQQKGNLAVQVTEMVCRKCGKKLSVTWERCPYCLAINPFYINPNPAPPPVVSQPIAPPPQVIIKEERVIIKEEKKEEEKGCGTIIGEGIGSLIVLGFIIGMLQSCGICAG